MTTTLSKADKPPVCPEVKVGDFFVCSWGYDQTNIDYYKVVSRTKATVKIQKWQSARVGEDGYHDSMVPGSAPATFVDWSGVDQSADYWTQQEQKVERPVGVRTKRLNAYSDRAVLSMNSYSNAYHWDGKAHSQTGAYGGH